MEAKWNRKMWHDQREKPNNLKLAQQTKALIHNQLADKAKARLPTFSHNLHLVIHYIFLALNNIHQITTYRLFDSIQLCVYLIPSNAPHFFVSPTAIPVNRCLTECDFIRKTPPSSGQVIDFVQLIRETPPVYGQTEHLESTILSNKDHSSEQDSLAPQKAKLHAGSQKLVKPNSGIARCEL